MNKILMYLGAFTLLSTTAFAGGTLPKEPVQVPAATAQSYITNYRTATLNFFAHGYLLNLESTAAMSPNGVRMYNGLEGEQMKIVLAPLNSSFEVSNGPCYMQSDERLCPKYCDIVQIDAMGAPESVSPEQAGNCVNFCIECRKYETVNAVTIFNKTLNTLRAAGFKYVRIYNGIDAGSKRYVVYIPVDAQGKEVAVDQIFVGDWTSALTNAKYPR